jgi:putative copper export protein
METGIFQILPSAFFKWLEIATVVFLLGAVSFREMVYLPGIQAVKDGTIREQMLFREDALGRRRLHRMLSILILIQVLVFFYRLGVEKGDISLSLIQTSFGVIWLAKLFLVALLFALSRSNISRKGLFMMALGSLLCLTGSFSGHAFASGTIYLVLSDWLHFTAVSIWAGGLLPLRDSAARSQEYLGTKERAIFLVRLVEVFSIWAIFCVVIIVMTGSFKATMYLAPEYDVREALYGNVLLIKLSIVSIAIGLGGVSRFYILPRLEKIKGSVSEGLLLLEKQFYLVLTVEAVFVALVLSFAAILTQTPVP